jgi:hypothetical protein
VGALAALSAALIFGLLGTAVGTASIEKISSWHTIAMIDVAFILCAAFFSFVIGGWLAGKVTGAPFRADDSSRGDRMARCNADSGNHAGSRSGYRVRRLVCRVDRVEDRRGRRRAGIAGCRAQ